LVIYGLIQLIILCFLFLLFLWIDWNYKCRKSVKDNNLSKYITGFLVMGNLKNKDEIRIIGCILGINSTQLIFVNHFKNDAIHFSTEISNICEFSITNYDENEFIKYVKKYSSGENGIVKYFVRSMTGLSLSKRIPKIIKNRMLCKINFSNEEEKYFFYKNTKRNVCNMNFIHK
jgi:hypothetical protein